MTKRLWEVPKSWVWTTISEIGEIVSGATPSTKNAEFWGGEVVWFAPSDLTGYKKKYIERGAKTLTEKGLASCSAKLMPAGSVMFSSRAPVGYVAINSVPAATNQGFKTAVPFSGIFNEFMYHYLKASKQLAEERATGTTFKELSGKAFGVLPVPVPPLNEQRRIVTKIEAMFEEIDAGTQSLRAAQAKLGLYRQSLLKSAFEGRLTADWRAQNPDKLEDPGTLLSRIQSERDTRYTAALDDWQKALTQWREDGEQGKKPAKPKRPLDLDPTSEITLGHVVLDVAQGWSPKCENHASTADDIWGVIKTTAIQAAKFLSEENKELPDSLQPRKWLELQNGDVIITRAGPRTRVGVACMVKKTRPKLMLCDKAYRLNYLETMVLPEFLEGYLSAPNTQKRIEVIKSGINDSGLNLKQDQFLALDFWLPSIAEQSEIVRILDAKLEAADALEAEITAALTRASALRQSILKKAFSGRLVPQDPNDEPASALLDRIKANRAAAPKAKRTRKTSA